MKSIDARARMLNAALQLFHRHGINGTSIDAVLKKSNTGKSQFTHYFKTKDGLVHAVLEYLHDIIRSGQSPTGYNIKSWKDMNRWFDRYIQFQIGVACELSCPMGTIANDITNDQKLLRKDVRFFMGWCHGQLARFFAERKAAGEMISRANPDGLAHFCIAVMQGGMLMTKINRDPSAFKAASAEALTHIHSMRKKKA